MTDKDRPLARRGARRNLRRWMPFLGYLAALYAVDFFFGRDAALWLAGAVMVVIVAMGFSKLEDRLNDIENAAAASREKLAEVESQIDNIHRYLAILRAQVEGGGRP